MSDEKKTKLERQAFAGFLAVYPSFAREVAHFQSVKDDPPDIIAPLNDGTRVSFELVQWLHGEQIVSAKRRVNFERAALAAIGDQGAHPSRHFRWMMLTPRVPVAEFAVSDADAFATA